MRTLTIRQMQQRVNEIVAKAKSADDAVRLVENDKTANELCKEIMRTAAWQAYLHTIDGFIAAARRNLG